MEVDPWAGICRVGCLVDPWACKGREVWEVQMEWATAICQGMDRLWARTKGALWDRLLEWDLEE